MKVVILGAGGHAQSVLEAIKLLPDFEVVGLFDDNPNLWKTKQWGFPVVGGIEALKLFPASKTVGFVVAIGNNQKRRELFLFARSFGFVPVTIVHPKATVSSSSQVGSGTVILANAAIGPGTRIGEDVIINTSAVVDHDCKLSDHVHISQGAVLAGNVIVGEGALISVGAIVASNCKIAAWERGTPGKIYP